jgi:hypothetical protein
MGFERSAALKIFWGNLLAMGNKFWRLVFRTNSAIGQIKVDSPKWFEFQASAAKSSIGYIG